MYVGISTVQLCKELKSMTFIWSFYTVSLVTFSSFVSFYTSFFCLVSNKLFSNIFQNFMSRYALYYIYNHFHYAQCAVNILSWFIFLIHKSPFFSMLHIFCATPISSKLSTFPRPFLLVSTLHCPKLIWLFCLSLLVSVALISSPFLILYWR